MSSLRTRERGGGVVTSPTASGRSADGRLIVLMLSDAARLEEEAASAPVDVAGDLLAAAEILRHDAGQPPEIITASQRGNLDHARRFGARR